jgi:ActR/RegA family two-component response regulator
MPEYLERNIKEADSAYVENHYSLEEHRWEHIRNISHDLEADQADWK